MTGSLSLDVFNPSNGELVGSPNADSMASAFAKLDQAYRFFKKTKSHLAPHQRIELLDKLADYVVTQKANFLETMIKEGGKPRKDSEVEFNRAVQGIKLAVKTVSERVGSTIPLGYQASSAQRFANTRVFPRGVVLAFSAFNHPLNLIVHQVIPAFAAGCPCVVKPAPDTPLSCLLLIQAMHHVGIPEEYAQVVVTNDLGVAGALVESEKIAFFSFIGSSKVGWTLRSKLKPGVRCALEHGGVAPCIVSKQADLELAVSAIAKGGFYHAGQVCVSTQRVYAESTIVDEFVNLLKSKVTTLIAGDAICDTTDIGPLIRKGEVARIHSWVQEAIAEGAECVAGGKMIDQHFYSPTILFNPAVHSKVSQLEIFGPVVCVYPYYDFDEVLERANHEQFAFQSAIFTRDLGEILHAYEAVEASALMVNDHTAFRDDIMPFAGLKSSGLGVGGIPYTIEDMQYEKMLVIK